jgi:1-deoxy-D-xylulose-5-phosphate reductoisomerase
VPFGKVNLAELGRLTFRPPDMDRFPALRLAYSALDAGDSALITLNASNEVASGAFLEGRIGFTDITGLVEEALGRHPRVKEGSTTWRRSWGSTTGQKHIQKIA